jgi:hypothetical protein
VIDPHPRGERLGDGGLQALERLLGPAHHAVGRLLGLDLAALLRIVAGLGQRARALDHVIGSLHDDVTAGVEPGPSGATGDLMKLARLQQPMPVAVVLGQAREDHRADRDVDAHAKRVGAADHLQQAGLRELLHQAPVARQHPGMVHADAAPHELGERAPEAGGEAKRAERVRDRVALLSRAQLRRQQRLGTLHRGGLREVHDVDRRPVGRGELLQQLVDRLDRPREGERHRPLGVSDDHGLTTSPASQVVRDLADVAERGRHEQKLRVGQGQQRHLPRPAALAVGVVVKLVHHDLADVRAGAFAQRDVGQDLRRAADDRRIGVDRGVPGQHAHVVGPEDRAEREELLRDERLDRRRVERDPAIGQRREVRGHRDQRLPGAGRRGEHHVVGAEQLDRRLLLVRVEGQALGRRPLRERVVQGFGAGIGGEGIDQAHAPGSR